MAKRQMRLSQRITIASAGMILALALLAVATRPGLAQNRAQGGPDPLLLARGAQIYTENCVMCHGETGQGRVGATLAKDWPSIKPDVAIKNTIVNGVAGSPMPAWSQEKGGPLTNEDIDALVVYLLSWETNPTYPTTPQPSATTRPAISPVPGVEGDPNRGAVIYDNNCKVCHGADGQGRVGAKLAKDWPSIRPDLAIKATISNGVPGSYMPAWSQEKGGPFGNEEVDDLVAYILTLPQPVGSVEGPTATPAPSSTGIDPVLGVAIGVILFILVISLIVLVQRPEKASD